MNKPASAFEMYELKQRLELEKRGIRTRRKRDGTTTKN
jgi:hypothetical protein